MHGRGTRRSVGRRWRTGATVVALLGTIATAAPVAAAEVDPPDATVTTPRPEQALPAGTVTFAGGATDDAGVAKVDVAVRERDGTRWVGPDGSLGPWAFRTATLAAPGATSTTWSLPWSLPAGSWGVWVRATDTAGKVDPTTSWVRFTTTAAPTDAAPPDTTIGTPAPDASVPQGPVAVAGSATDDVAVAGVAVVVTDGAGATVASGDAVLASPGAARTTWSFNLPAAAAGSYSVQATARDGAGRTDASPATRTFTVVAAEPPFTTPALERTIGRPGHASVHPWGIARALDGTLIVGDYLNYNVKRYDPATGRLLQTFGRQGTGAGRNAEPYGIAVSPLDGSIYVADPINYEIDRWSASGTFVSSLRVDPQITSEQEIYNARLAIDSRGWLYVPNSHNIIEGWQHEILVYDQAHRFQFRFGTVGSGSGQIGVVRGIAAGPGDEIFVIDQTSRRVSVFGPDGGFRRSFGQGRLQWDLRGITVSADAVYVVDASENEVDVFSLQGNHLRTIRTPGGSSAAQPAPGGDREIAIGADGNVYVPDFGNYRVNVFTPAGAFVRSLPNPPGAPPQGGFNGAEDVAVDHRTGDVFVVDTYNHRIQRFSSTGTFEAAWGYRASGREPEDMNYPRGIAVDPADGTVWLNNTRQGNIKHYTADGQLLGSFSSWGAGEAQLYYSRGIHVGTDGRIYVGDGYATQLKVFDRQGNLVWRNLCGALPDGTAGNILAGCTGVGLDASGNVYAAAPTEHVVYKFSPQGALLAKFGTSGRPGNGPVQFRHPHNVVVRGNRLYVTDVGNARVVVLDLEGRAVGTFGTRGPGAAQFSKPMGIDVDAAGRIYVADAIQERIKVFRP